MWITLSRGLCAIDHRSIYRAPWRELIVAFEFNCWFMKSCFTNWEIVSDLKSGLWRWLSVAGQVCRNFKNLRPHFGIFQRREIDGCLSVSPRADSARTFRAYDELTYRNVKFWSTFHVNKRQHLERHVWLTNENNRSAIWQSNSSYR